MPLFGNSSYAVLSRVFFYLDDMDIRAYFRSSGKSYVTVLVLEVVPVVVAAVKMRRKFLQPETLPV